MTATRFLLTIVIGALCIWTILSAGASLFSHKPFVQCFESNRMDCQ